MMLIMIRVRSSGSNNNDDDDNNNDMIIIMILMIIMMMMEIIIIIIIIIMMMIIQSLKIISKFHRLHNMGKNNTMIHKTFISLVQVVPGRPCIVL